MTANQIKGKGFRGALRYNLDKVNRGVAEVLDHSFASLSEATIMKEVQLVRVLRPNLQKYFYHTSINFPPCENLSNQLMMQIGHDYLEAMGFTQHQFIMVRHYDADHPHLHILVNRIGYDGKVVSDSNDYQRSERILRDLEVKYNLTRVTPSKEVKERAMTKDELEMMKRTHLPSQKVKLQAIIKKLLKERPGMTTQQFIQALESKSINVLFNQANTGFVSGISYSFEGFLIKGAKLGNDFKWASIRNVINYDQERDQGVIQEANTRTKVGARAEVRLGSVRENRSFSQGDFDLPASRSPDAAGRGWESLLKDLTRAHPRDSDQQPDPHYENTSVMKRQKKKRRGRRH